MSMPSLLKGVQTLKKRKIDENAGTSQVNKIIYFIQRFQFYFICFLNYYKNDYKN